MNFQTKAILLFSEIPLMTSFTGALLRNLKDPSPSANSFPFFPLLRDDHGKLASETLRPSFAPRRAASNYGHLQDKRRFTPTPKRNPTRVQPVRARNDKATLI